MSLRTFVLAAACAASLAGSFAEGQTATPTAPVPRTAWPVEAPPRPLAARDVKFPPYQIQKLPKAHYICMNIECDNETLVELETAFKFNDAVLRHLTVKMKKAETTPSPMMKSVQREDAAKSHRAEAPAPAAAAPAPAAA